MPNQPRDDNKARSFRCEDDLWRAAVKLADAQGIRTSEVVREALRSHLRHSPVEPATCP